MNPAASPTNEIKSEVWRIGFAPEPWAWSDWSYAVGGRFQGRWDDPKGEFRTIYAGETLKACLGEVLAGLRPSIQTLAEFEEIDEDPDDAIVRPLAQAGAVPLSWLDSRIATTAMLTGTFYRITALEAIADLRNSYARWSVDVGFLDFDAATLKDQRSRPITQAIAREIWAELPVDGIEFASRLGDEQRLWAIFERFDDGPISKQISPTGTHTLAANDPDLVDVMRAFGLHWEES